MCLLAKKSKKEDETGCVYDLGIPANLVPSEEFFFLPLVIIMINSAPCRPTLDLVGC